MAAGSYSSELFRALPELCLEGTPVPLDGVGLLVSSGSRLRMSLDLNVLSGQLL